MVRGNFRGLDNVYAPFSDLPSDGLRICPYSVKTPKSNNPAVRPYFSTIIVTCFLANRGRRSMETCWSTKSCLENIVTVFLFDRGNLRACCVHKSPATTSDRLNHQNSFALPSLCSAEFFSLLALISYPFFVEPFIGLKEQTVLWSTGYVIFVFSAVWHAILVRKQKAMISQNEDQDKIGRQNPKV